MLSLFKQTIDFFLHLDTHVGGLIQQYGTWTYALLFLIIFSETGLVVAPFFPGDSLLFTAGAFAAIGSLNVFWLYVVLALAAILGDTVNYWIGRTLGPRAFHEHSRILKKKHLDETHAFFEKYGNKTIVLARFVPIIRTFAPFVAGVGSMQYKKFLSYNILGGLVWTALGILCGFFFGNIPWVKVHFSSVILLIVLISLLPIVVEWFNARTKKV